MCACVNVHLLYLYMRLMEMLSGHTQRSATTQGPGGDETRPCKLGPVTFQGFSMEHPICLPSQHLLCLREGGANMKKSVGSSWNSQHSLLGAHCSGCWRVVGIRGFPLHQSECPVSQVTQLSSSAPNCQIWLLQATSWTAEVWHGDQ